ncbi:hypothetical protein KFL_000270110 [Klebsormidium nitens]|uniref:Uncharacterized protein n=1 Tax=Klebsormidium nitens TaxID=105231 RepID=A0A1Y1HNE6_KLENI|nr:hypothetical protein KFL_000270110 [Klebsormidium nitens]|eukprot:GAQ79252.1 hypothetical protein KFL_000270110 [Klebsormidium nitens]
MMGKRKLGAMETVSPSAQHGAQTRLCIETEAMGFLSREVDENDASAMILNQSLERVRLQALKNAEAKETAQKAQKPRRIPPLVMPHDPGTTYDFTDIKRVLNSPVTLQEFSEPELRSAFILLASALKVVRQIDEKERIMQCLSVCSDELLGRVSETEFWTAMVRNGLAALLLGVVPEEDTWKLLQATIDVVSNEDWRSQGFLHALQTLTPLLGKGGIAFIQRLISSSALERVLAKFVGENLALEDLLKPADVNTFGWTLRLFFSIGSSFDSGTYHLHTASKEALEILVRRGAVGRILEAVTLLTTSAETVDTTRLEDLCKMLELCTEVLASCAVGSERFLQELKQSEGFAENVAWFIRHWDYTPTASHASLTLLWKMFFTGPKFGDLDLPLSLASQEGLLERLAAFVDYVPEYRTRNPIADVSVIAEVFLGFLSLEPLPPGAFSPPVVRALCKIATGANFPGYASQATGLIRHLVPKGSVSVDAVRGAAAAAALHGLVDLKCDQCGAAKGQWELKRCSRCK